MAIWPHQYNYVLTLWLLLSTLIDGEVVVAEPTLAKVTIYEVAERPWGWLVTNAEVGDRVYVGSREWRQQQLGNNQPRMK